jgi:transposase
MGRPILQIPLDAGDRNELRRRVRSGKTSRRDSLRARIILRRAEGRKPQDVADELGVSHVIVSKWTRRFINDGLEGLSDAKGRGRKPSLPPEKIEKVIAKATKPPPGRTRWSVRSMAREAGISSYSVHKIWRSNEIKPHLIKTFKGSNDPRFEEKFRDVIGLASKGTGLLLR